MVEREWIERASEFARRAHAGQVRKGESGRPYFDHLESVVQRLRAHGCVDPVSLAAGYLHDVIEDRPGFTEALRTTFPSEIVGVVDVLTERKFDGDGHPRHKSDRVKDYIAALASNTVESERARSVSCADKIDNLSGILASERSGTGLLARLNTRPGQHAPQLAALRAQYARSVRPSLLAEFDAASHALAAYLDWWLPGRAVAIAASVHEGYVDASRRPYALHGMAMVSRANSGDARIVAALHDLPDAAGWTAKRLSDEGLGERLVAAIEALRSGDRARIGADALAAEVDALESERGAHAERTWVGETP